MKQQLQTYIHEHIPLSNALGVEVQTAALDQVALSAPFANNINHKKTVFGGSLQAVATLACWGLAYLNLEQQNLSCEIVITNSDINYLLPVTTDFTAKATLPEKLTWDRFSKILAKHGKARIKIHATIYQGDKLTVDYIGTFAAVR